MDANDRCNQAANMRLRGETYSEIGKLLGISPERARQLSSKGLRSMDLTDHWLNGLPSSGAASAILRAGFTSKDQLREAIDRSQEIKWVGKKSRLEVQEWLKDNSTPAA